MHEDDVFRRAIGNGRPLLHIVGLALVFSGCFAIFVALRGEFLPHDALHVGFAAHELGDVRPELARFMFHNRAAWGGGLIAMGLVWLWLSNFPLAQGQRAAWRTLLVSGAAGFATFLTFVGYGYFDLWHGIATVALLPFFVVGIVRTRQMLATDDEQTGPRGLTCRTTGGCLLWIYAAGLLLAGATILVISVTVIFVPEDLVFMQLCGADINLISERLLPVIAHDRSSFGGALLTLGLTLVLVFRTLTFTRALWQVVGLSGIVGFGAAIGIHHHVGYLSLTHLAPAYFGLVVFLIGWLLSRREIRDTSREASSPRLDRGL